MSSKPVDSQKLVDSDDDEENGEEFRQKRLRRKLLQKSRKLKKLSDSSEHDNEVDKNKSEKESQSLQISLENSTPVEVINESISVNRDPRLKSKEIQRSKDSTTSANDEKEKTTASIVNSGKLFR